VRLVADRGFAQRLGAAGRERLLAERWTWQGNAARVVEVYEHLAGAPR
jgi:glycosyltransferase involved in cell wall biosynthesis